METLTAPTLSILGAEVTPKREARLAVLSVSAVTDIQRNIL
jgi:hypothetical protein